MRRKTLFARTASILDRASLPRHHNISTNERKALNDLKNDRTRVIMKADKGNSLVIMGSKWIRLKDGKFVIQKPPFKKIERELNAILLELNKQEKLPDNTYRKLHSSDAIPPAIRGSIKHHKTDMPLRPIVTCIGSAFYNTSKFLAQILSPLQNKNGFSVTNSLQFKNDISDITIFITIFFIYNTTYKQIHLAERRRYHRCLYMFKYINGLTFSNLDITAVKETHSYITRSKTNLRLPKIKRN